MDAEAGIAENMAAGRHARAFDLIVPAYRDKVFRLAYSILKERTAAEDAAQEALVRVWKALPGFDGRAALGTWIYAITRNTCLMELRRRRPTVSFDDPDSAEAAQAAARIATGPAEDPERDNLLRLLDTLPRNQQEAVRLFYLEDRSYEAVAERLAMPLGTVKNLLHRARKRLMELADPAEVKAA
jgi:RNA polymerase sigma-70 factor (ECF subfamily)